MATIPTDEINPFRAPVAPIGAATLPGVTGDVEVIRLTFINHEASVKAIGSLNYLGAFVSGIVFVTCSLTALGVITPGADNQSDPATRLGMGIGAGIAIMGFVCCAGIGYGLRHLHQWARWLTIVVVGLSLLVRVARIGLVLALSKTISPQTVGALIGSAILAYVIWLMASSKGAMVFSTQYREIIRQTQHIQYKMSFVVKFLIGLVIVVILIAAVGILNSLVSR